MRKVFALVPVVLLLLLPWSLAAQATPQAELFGGYAFARMENVNMNGWNGAVTGYFSHSLGMTLDASGDYGSHSFTDLLGNENNKLNYNSFLVGPHYVESAGHGLNPFAQALFGFTRRQDTLDRSGNAATASSASVTNYGFGMALGAGVDLRRDKPLGIRLIQVDYYLVRAGGLKHEGVRVSTGITWRWGQRRD